MKKTKQTALYVSPKELAERWQRARFSVDRISRDQETLFGRRKERNGAISKKGGGSL